MNERPCFADYAAYSETRPYKMRETIDEDTVYHEFRLTRYQAPRR